MTLRSRVQLSGCLFAVLGVYGCCTELNAQCTFGVVDSEKDVYAAVFKKFAPDELLFTRSNDPLAKGMTYRFPAYKGDAVAPAKEWRPYEVRWKIQDEYLWYVGVSRTASRGNRIYTIYRIPKSSLTSLNSHSKGIEEWGTVGKPSAIVWGVPEDGGPDYNSVAIHCTPLVEAAERQDGPLQFDIRPITSRKCEILATLEPGPVYPGVFEASEHRECVLLCYEFSAVEDPVFGIGWHGLWSVVGKTNAPFQGSFHYVRSGEKLFMVSDAGSVYEVRRPAKEREPLGIELITTVKPLRVLLAADNGQAAFAFTGTEKCRLESALKYEPCRIAPKDADVPLSQLRACARCIEEVK